MKTRLLVLGTIGLLVAGFLPSALASEVKSSTTVKNSNPLVEAIGINVPDDDTGTAGMQVSPTPGTDRVLPFFVRVSDANGWKDISKVSFRFQAPSGAALVSGEIPAIGTGSGRTLTLTGNWTLPFWQAPGTYAINVTVYDKPGSTHTLAWSFDVVPTLAMTLGASSLALGDSSGSLEPGSSNHNAPASVSIRNLGNVILDLGVSGTDLKADGFDATIPASKMHYSSASSMAGEVSLASTLWADTAFNLAPGANSAKTAYFDLHMPTGDEQYVPAATYKGNMTLSAVVNS